MLLPRLWALGAARRVNWAADGLRAEWLAWTGRQAPPGQRRRGCII